MDNRICSECGRDPTSFCYCDRKDTFFCDNCVQKHHLQYRYKFHQICPLSAFPDHTIPGYYHRLSSRIELVARGKDSLLKNIDTIDTCITDLNTKIVQITDLLTDYVERTIMQLYTIKSELETNIRMAILEVEETMYYDKPILHNELAVLLRDFGQGWESLKLFDYVIDQSPFPSSIDKIVQFTQGIESGRVNLSAKKLASAQETSTADLEREMMDLRLKHEDTVSKLGSVQDEYKVKDYQCAKMKLAIGALNYQEQESQPSEGLLEVTQKHSALEARLLKWGITCDPPEEAQDPVPDYSTPQSRASLQKFGPFLCRDEARILVIRGPVLLPNGVYTGQWNSQPNPDGYGKLVTPQGCIYEGQWRNGEMTGFGRFIWSNGDVYIGELLNGICKGMGIKYYSNGAVHSGMWANGKLHGFGAIKFNGGSQYTYYFGEFLDDERCGRGVAFGYDGDLYAGSWKDNRAHGKGVNVWATGHIYLGDWEYDMKSGIGCFVTPDGEVVQGLWQDNELCDQ